MSSTGQPGQQPPRRAKHLMDPNQPRPRTSPEDIARLEKVQRRVLTALTVTTILHLSAGLAIASDYIDRERTDAIIGLNVLAAAFGVCAVASGLAIYKKSLLSPLLLLGLVPGIVGLVWVLG